MMDEIKGFEHEIQLLITTPGSQGAAGMTFGAPKVAKR